MRGVMRRVGRPPRLDERRPVPTFFQKKLRELVRASASAVNMPMSDWISLQCDEWLASPSSQHARILRTHPRKEGNCWVPVQVVLAAGTYNRLLEYANERDVAIASLVYTIVLEACSITPKELTIEAAVDS